MKVLEAGFALPAAVQTELAEETGSEVSEEAPSTAAEDSEAHIQYLAFAICLPEGAGVIGQGAAIEHLGLQIVAEQMGVTEK